jgi:hypothetical protein
VEKIHRPTWSLPASCDSELMAACLAKSSFVLPALPTVSSIEPDASMTNSTFARLRNSAQLLRMRSVTAGAGDDNSVTC